MPETKAMAPGRRWLLSTEAQLLVAIVLVALVVRVALMFYLNAHIIENTWDFGFETGRIARSLASGEGFGSPFGSPTGPTAWLMPAYPYLLSMVFKVFGVYSKESAVMILCFNSLVSAVSCVPLYLLAKRVFNTNTAVLAASMLAIYPPSIWHAINTIWGTTLLALLCLLLVYLFYETKLQPNLRRIGLLGASLGLAVWVNPVPLLFVPFLWLWILTRSGQSRKWKIAASSLLTGALLLVISPWMVRNWLQFGGVFLRSNLGVELKLGNSSASWENFLAGSPSDTGPLGHPSYPREFARFSEVGEVQYTRLALREALTFIKQNPGKFARMTLHRVRVFWLGKFTSEKEWVGNLRISQTVARLKKLVYVLPLPFVFIGLVQAVRLRLDVGPTVALLLLFPSVYYVTHVVQRYRYPIEPFLLLLASFGIVSVLEYAGFGSRKVS